MRQCRKSRKILHYMFGVPPVRAGGMVRYASDLMVQQRRTGDQVYLLLPGALPMDTGKKTKIYRRKADYLGIPAYVIYNPLTVAVFNVILDTSAYTAPCNLNAFSRFLHKLQPDIVHIHTFMGLHREFLAQARRFNIPVIFTSHDYFGICPTAVLMSGGHLCTDIEWRTCAQCCKEAFPKWRLWMEQAAWYGRLRKKDRLVGLIKSGICKNSRRTGSNSAAPARKEKPDYASLRDYYVSMFDMVSCFHFNSTQAAGIYHSRLGHLQQMREVILPVSHCGISDCRKKRSYGSTLRIGYIGSWSQHKGFFALMQACRYLVQSGCADLELHLYSGTAHRTECFVRNHPGFAPTELAAVMDSIDLLALPSRWRETFGLAAVEAVSYGVPVLLPEYAGAADIFKGNDAAGLLYDGTVQGLKETLRRIYKNRELLVQANRGILKLDYDFSFQHHVRKMAEIYMHETERRSVIKE